MLTVCHLWFICAAGVLVPAQQCEMKFAEQSGTQTNYTSCPCTHTHTAHNTRTHTHANEVAECQGGDARLVYVPHLNELHADTGLHTIAGGSRLEANPPPLSTPLGREASLDDISSALTDSHAAYAASHTVVILLAEGWGKQSSSLLLVGLGTWRPGETWGWADQSRVWQLEHHHLPQLFP